MELDDFVYDFTVDDFHDIPFIPERDPDLRRILVMLMPILVREGIVIRPVPSLLRSGVKREVIMKGVTPIVITFDKEKLHFVIARDYPNKLQHFQHDKPFRVQVKIENDLVSEESIDYLIAVLIMKGYYKNQTSL